jgi:GNAT superfamily N-acetyltransferase
VTFTFRLINQVERSVFKQFHNTLFANTDASDEWFIWYFDKIGQGTTRIHGAFDGDQLVGSWCVEPKQLLTDRGTFLNVGRCFAVGVHPDYRRHGLFVDLSKHAIAAERALMEYEYILGFPQVGRPVIGAHLKAGWDIVQRIDIKSFELKKPKQLTSLNEVKIITDFRGEFRLPSREVGMFVDNADYRNLRWLNHPDNHYICLGVGASYIVMKPYAYSCHILDLYGNHKEARHLLNAAKTLAWRHKWKELSIWCASNDYYSADVRACDFIDGALYADPVEMLAVKISTTRTFKKFELARWCMGSEEVY